jgi:hypothetical protein
MATQSVLRWPGIIGSSGGIAALLVGILAGLLTPAVKAAQLTGHRVPLKGHNLETFRAIWERGSEEERDLLLRFAVRIGAYGGVTQEEVEKFAPRNPDAQLGRLHWLWAFGDHRPNLNNEYYAYDLAAYGYLPPPQPGEPNDPANLGRAIQTAIGSPNPILAWRLRAICNSSRDQICWGIAASARKALQTELSIDDRTTASSGQDADPYALQKNALLLWAADPSPEPALFNNYLKKELRLPPPSFEDHRSGDREILDILESWNSPDIADLAMAYPDWEMLFRLGRTISSNPRPDPTSCLVTEDYVDDEKLIRNVRRGGALSWMDAFCASDPKVLVDYLQWVNPFYGTPNPPFSLAKGRALLALLVSLSSSTGNADYDSATIKGNDYIDLIPVLVDSGRDKWTLADVPLLRAASREMSRWQQAQREHTEDRQKLAQQVALIDTVVEHVSGLAVVSHTLLIGCAYFSLWLVCLCLYPWSNWVRANVLWNSRLRKVFFIFNPLLFSVPFLRRLIFRPFLGDLSKEAGRKDTGAMFFEDLQVVEDGKVLKLVSALPAIRGRVVLQGRSGLGKTTFLRRLTKLSRDSIVYLEARRCSGGVLPAIQNLLPGWLKDEEFLGSFVFHGGLAVVIDGLNEAGESARTAIAAFLTQAAGGRVVVSSQPMNISWPSRVRVLELLPLDEERARQFLVLQGISPEQARDVMSSAMSMRSESDREAATLVMSNPFDLAVIAEMVRRKIPPNLLSLPEQQYRTMAAKFKERENYEFPLDRFSDEVYKMLIEDRQTIDDECFTRELGLMAEERMVIDRNQCYTFRHDKIRDFFLVAALDQKDRISKHYGDPRFQSAYLSLALRLPIDEARDLREDVDEWALDNQDRSLADELRRALRRRKGESETATSFKQPVI